MVSQAAFMWSKKFSDTTGEPLHEVLRPFLVYIKFHKIPASILMTEIHPLGLVPYSHIMTALAYQADPTSVSAHKVSPNRGRKARVAGRTSSIQSSVDPWFGSSTTLSSTNSSMTMEEISEGRVSNTLYPEMDLLSARSRCSSRSSRTSHNSHYSY